MASQNHEFNPENSDNGNGRAWDTPMAEIIASRAEEQRKCHERMRKLGINAVSTKEWLEATDKPSRPRSISTQPDALDGQGLLKGSERQDR